MSKAVLEFDLSDPDDVMEHKRCVKALDMALVIWEFNHNCKKSLEYKIEDMMNKNKDFSPFDSIDVVYEHFRELLEENSIDINDLVE